MLSLFFGPYGERLIELVGGRGGELLLEFADPLTGGVEVGSKGNNQVDEVFGRHLALANILFELLVSHDDKLVRAEVRFS